MFILKNMFINPLLYICPSVLSGWKTLSIQFDFINKCHFVGKVSCCSSTIVGIVADDAVILYIVFDDLDYLLYDVAFDSIDVICID